jgi:hypothetical protein
MLIFLKLPLQKVSNLNLVGAAVAEINKLNEEKAKKEAALTGNQYFIQNSTADFKKNGSWGVHASNGDYISTSSAHR